MVRITENITSELNELCTRMGLRTFVEREIVFFKEYYSVLRPLARGLDISTGGRQLFLWNIAPNSGDNYKENKGSSSTPISYNCWAC